MGPAEREVRPANRLFTFYRHAGESRPNDALTCAGAEEESGGSNLKLQKLEVAPDQAPRSLIISLTACLLLGALFWTAVFSAVF